MIIIISHEGHGFHFFYSVHFLTLNFGIFSPNNVKKMVLTVYKNRFLFV